MLCKALPRGSHRGRREACACLQHFEHSHQTGSVHQSSTSERQIFLGKLPWASWAEQCPEGGGWPESARAQTQTQDLPKQQGILPHFKHLSPNCQAATLPSALPWLLRTTGAAHTVALFYLKLYSYLPDLGQGWRSHGDAGTRCSSTVPECSTSRHSWFSPRLSHLCNILSEHGWRIGVVFISWQPLQQPNPSQFAFSWARPILAVYVRKVGWVEWSFSQVTFLFNVTFPLTEHKFLPLFICVPHWLGLNSVAVSGNYWHLKCWLWGYWN